MRPSDLHALKPLVLGSPLGLPMAPKRWRSVDGLLGGLEGLFQ